MIRARPTLTALGPVALLDTRPLAFFCSARCPGEIILQTYDLIRTLRDAGVAMIGGFHSPMEKECLTLLLRGRQPVIVCPARGIEGMRLPRAWKQPMTDQRLLVISPFEGKVRRITAETSEIRNRFVALLAGQILIAHAAAGSNTEELFRTVSAWGKPVWTLPSTANAHLIVAGARPLTGPTALLAQAATD